MNRTRDDFGARYRASTRQPEPPPAVVAAAAFMATASGFLSLALPAELVLPALSGALIVAALAVATFAWARPTRRIEPSRITYWDISGALYLIGCGAAVLGEVESLVPLMEEIKLRR
jgi:hypothetical protein